MKTTIAIGKRNFLIFMLPSPCAKWIPVRGQVRASCASQGTGRLAPHVPDTETDRLCNDGIDQIRGIRANDL
jgi:hypothetical protein